MASAKTVEAPTGTAVVWMDPADVLTDKNIRDLVLDEEFLDSVGDLGVLVPTVALRTKEGRTRVWLGNRRVAAAVVKGKQVPVWTVGDEGDTQAMQRVRVLGQYDENKQRRALTAGEEAGVVQVLFDLKMTAPAIGKRMKMDPAQVAAARKVAKSEFATKAAGEHNLNMMESAVIAEFADAGDGEAATALIAQHRDNPRQFEHLAQRLRDSTVSRAERRAVVDALEAAGITVLISSQYQNRLTGLRDADGTEVTTENHAGCPGHAAYITQGQEKIDSPPESGSRYRDVWTVQYVCTDPDAYGHTRPPERTQPDKTDDERAADLAKKRAVREGNKAWKSATTVRMKFLASFAARKTAPKDAAEFMAAYISGSGYALRQSMERNHPLACEIFGLAKPEDNQFYNNERKERIAALVDAAAPARRIVIGLTILLTACERQCADTATWNQQDSPYWSLRADAGMYLAYLEAQGHVLSEIEATVAHPAPPAEPDSDTEIGSGGDDGDQAD